MSLFDEELILSAVDTPTALLRFDPLPCRDFLLNPRRLRGSDFLMRWSQGRWSEDRIVEAVGATGDYVALRYGPSGTAPHDDPREFELYFERLEAAGLADVKRPDVLIFAGEAAPEVETIVDTVGGEAELPFRPETDPIIQRLLNLAIVAVECENSLWVCRDMPDFGAELRPQKRLAGKPGLPKSAVVPTLIIKEEDRERLRVWQEQARTPVHLLHVFYDLAYGIAFDRVERLISDGLIEPCRQLFQAPGGATTSKIIYKVYYHYAYRLGQVTDPPTLRAESIKDTNGHVLPFVRFDGGRIVLDFEALTVLSSLLGDAE